MNCDRAQRNILLLDAGELTGRLRTDTQEHLEQCAACTAFYAEAQQIIMAAKQTSDSATPAPLIMARIMTHAAEAARSQPVILRPSFRIAAAAALLLALLGTWSLLPTAPTEPTLSDRLDHVHAILAIVADDTAVTTSQPEEAEDKRLRSLAAQLLEMEGLAAGELSAEEFWAPQTTNPLSRSEPGLHATGCV